MSTYYVIRAGRVRGGGAYYCGGCGDSHVEWTTGRADAFPFESRAEAEHTHEVLLAQARVVKVTRRTSAEIREECARICERVAASASASASRSALEAAAALECARRIREAQS